MTSISASRTANHTERLCLPTCRSSHTPTKIMGFSGIMGKAYWWQADRTCIKAAHSQLVCKTPIFLICVALTSIFQSMKGNAYLETW